MKERFEKEQLGYIYTSSQPQSLVNLSVRMFPMFKFLVHIPLHELNNTYQRSYPEFDSQQQKKFFCHKIKGDDATEGSWFQIGLKLHLEDPSYIECSISQTVFLLFVKLF